MNSTIGCLVRNQFFQRKQAWFQLAEQALKRWFRRPNETRREEPTSKKRRAPRGFSLLEAVVSSTILLTGISILSSSIGSVSRVNQRQRLLTSAIHAAESVTEELLLKVQSDPLLVMGNHLGPQFDQNMRRVNAGPVVTSYVVSAGPVAGIKRIEVTAQSNAIGTIEAVTMVTFRR